jgi:hypothetical protein
MKENSRGSAFMYDTFDMRSFVNATIYPPSTIIKNKVIKVILVNNLYNIRIK